MHTIVYQCTSSHTVAHRRTLLHTRCILCKLSSTLTYCYIPLHTSAHRSTPLHEKCIALHTAAHRCTPVTHCRAPLHTVAYRYIPSHTIPYWCTPAAHPLHTDVYHGQFCSKNQEGSPHFCFGERQAYPWTVTVWSWYVFGVMSTPCGVFTGPTGTATWGR